MNKPEFDLQDFLPYLLNRAAERASKDFQTIYKNEYGMLLTEWRVLYHLGRYGSMTARSICDLGGLHKTKVSRAVAALEKKRYLSRQQSETDKREELLQLTTLGNSTFRKLEQRAQDYQTDFRKHFTDDEFNQLLTTLHKLIKVS